MEEMKEKKMSKESSNVLNFLFGLVSGIVTGTIIGLLSAPKSGEEIREGVKYTLHEKATKISSKLDELAKRGSDVLVQDELN